MADKSCKRIYNMAFQGNVEVTANSAADALTELGYAFQFSSRLGESKNLGFRVLGHKPVKPEEPPAPGNLSFPESLKVPDEIDSNLPL